MQPRTEVVGIDEAQFLGEEVLDVCTKLANLGKRVIVAGLDTDFRGRPFEPMPRLLAVAEEITKLLAICVRCGNPAVHTQRLVENEDLIVVGASDAYEARCRRCLSPIPHRPFARKTDPTSSHVTGDFRQRVAEFAPEPARSPHF